jgi:hypothetical protein
LIAVLAAGGLYLALPSDLTVGPSWLFPGLIAVFLVPAVISDRAGRHHLDRILGFTIHFADAAGLLAARAVNLL